MITVPNMRPSLQILGWLALGLVWLVGGKGAAMRHRIHGTGLPFDGTHRQGWNDGLSSLENALREDYGRGQLVSREDVIRHIRLLMDYTRLGERGYAIEEQYRRAGLNDDGSLPDE
jgi:hypothetical protein